MDGICWCNDLWRASINAQYLTQNDLFYEIRHPLFDATILMQGAQLIHFQPKGGEPFFWSAKRSTLQKGKAFRGGIPVCWPWFGKASTPSHGFARIVEWKMVQYVEHEEGVQLVFELHDSAFTRSLWDYAFSARLEMHLGFDVELRLHVNAEKESTAALHSYLTCKDIHDVTVMGLGSAYNDALQGGLVCKEGEAILHVKHEVDRVYTTPEATTLLFEADRTLSITHENHSDVVVWNPWHESERNFSDMKEGDYTKMLCIESARISKPLACEDYLHVKIAML
jgi:glucose-6-phosphate 1-epimerase